VPVLILPTGPADRVETASLMIQQFLHLAEKRFWISTPYLVPDEGVVASLQLAAIGGIDVRLLIPETSDSKLVSLAAYPFIDPLLAWESYSYRRQWCSDQYPQPGQSVVAFEFRTHRAGRRSGVYQRGRSHV
jgi:cardiolipin synthase